MNNDELYRQLCNIISNILTITAVKAGIGYPMADPWLADIGIHCFDEKVEKEVIDEIYRIYNLPSDDHLIDAEIPLMLLALRIYLYRTCSLDIQQEMKPYIIKLDESEKRMFGEK